LELTTAPTEKDEDKENNNMEEDEEDSQIANSQVAVYVNPLEQSGRQKILEKLHHVSDDNASHHEQFQHFARVLQGNELSTNTPAKKTTTPKSMILLLQKLTLYRRDYSYKDNSNIKQTKESSES
jgi:hypothetical protein